MATSRPGRDTEGAMSQRSEELVRQVVEATNRKDPEAFVATLSPDVDWEDAVFWTEGPRIFRGRAAVRGWLERVWEPWEDLQMEAQEIVGASNGRLFVELGLTARGKGSGVETQLRFWTVSWIADGRIAKRRAFRDRADALKAAGLRE
ncbi:MAG: SnoaL-like domain [Solirubrobacterales bacterium]|nr:SnoaL-like domain [Solirubrobacterales bacterium]